jgi:hypothetical protein
MARAGPRDAINDDPSRQSFEPAFASNEIPVVPLNVAGFLKPPLEVLCIHLFDCSEACLGRFECAFWSETGLVERLSAPEQQPDAPFQLAEPDDGISVEKPYGVGMPDLVLGLRQHPVDLAGQEVADLLIRGFERTVVGGCVGMHRAAVSF